MTPTTLIEYLDFRAGEDAREYRLRVRRGADSWGVTVAIPNEAFLSGLVRYQDTAVRFCVGPSVLHDGGGRPRRQDLSISPL